VQDTHLFVLVNGAHGAQRLVTTRRIIRYVLKKRGFVDCRGASSTFCAALSFCEQLKITALTRNINFRGII
jgi:hypothetical protein